MGNPEFGENSISTEEALTILRNEQRKATKRHARVHVEAMRDNTQRIRAVEGQCGKCLNLSIKKFIQDGKKCVGLPAGQKDHPLTLCEKQNWEKNQIAPIS